MATFDAITVYKCGVTVTAGGVPASVPIPNAATDRARFVRITSTGSAYVRPCHSSGAVTCTDNDLMVQPGDALILSVRAFDRIAYLQESPGPKINIVPVEF